MAMERFNLEDNQEISPINLHHLSVVKFHLGVQDNRM